MYEIDDTQAEPSLEQEITLFSASAENDMLQSSFIFPTVMVNNNQDLVIASSIVRANRLFDGILQQQKQ